MLEILTGPLSDLWFFSIDLIHLNAVSHEPLQDNVLKEVRKERMLPVFIVHRLYDSHDALRFHGVHVFRVFHSP